MEIISAFGWPHVSLMFAVFFVLLFRKPLRGLIGRITAVDKGGIKALPEVQTKENQKKESVEQLLLAVGDSPVIQDVELRIRAQLQERGLETDGDTIKVLIKHLAGTQILLQFERIHFAIFGSQIFLLKKLNEAPARGKPIEFIEAHFKHVQELFPKELGHWHLDEYLSFLISYALITDQAEAGVVHLTNLGLEFLTWMARNGKTEERPL
jgi:hypothetical protein